MMDMEKKTMQECNPAGENLIPLILEAQEKLRNHKLFNHLTQERGLTTAIANDFGLDVGELARRFGLGSFQRLFYPHKLATGWYPIFYIPNGRPKYLFPNGLPKPLLGAEYLREKNCLIVEGLFDYLSVRQTGLPCCCLLGALPGGENTKALAESLSPVIILDNDPGGKEAAEKLGLILPKARIGLLPEGKDPNDLLRDDPSSFSSRLNEIISQAKSLFEWRITELKGLPDGEKLSYLKERMGPIIRSADPAQQDYLINELHRVVAPLGVKTSNLRKVLLPIIRKPSEPSVSSVNLDPQGSVEVIQTDDGLYYWTWEGLKPSVSDCIPPPAEKVKLVLLPTYKALDYVNEPDEVLFEDVRRYIYEHVYLTDERSYTVITAWLLHTWLLELFDNSSQIHAIGPKGSGKTTLAELCKFLARRGFLTVNLNQAGIFRLAELYRLTLILDEFRVDRDQDVIHLLNSRFSKGAVVARINPDRPGFDSVTAYEFFGATMIIGDTLPDALASRTIRLSMERNIRPVRRGIDITRANELRDRLAAFRYRTIRTFLPDIEEIAEDRRFQDVLYPLHQMIQVAIPKREAEFISYCRELEKEKKEEEGCSLEAEIIKAVLSIENEVVGGKFPVAAVANILNRTRPQKEELKHNTVGIILNRLGFKYARTSDGHAARIWDQGLILRWAVQYRVSEGSEDPEGLPESKSEVVDNDGS